MAGKKIIWSARASVELKKTLEFYTERNKSSRYSQKLLGEIESIMKMVSKNEQIGRLTSNKSTRVIPMKVYLIFYDVKDQNIEIVSFWDNRQDNKE